MSGAESARLQCEVVLRENARLQAELAAAQQREKEAGERLALLQSITSQQAEDYAELARSANTRERQLEQTVDSLEQSREAQGQDVERLKDMLRSQICHACETRIGWEGTKMVCLVCSGVRAVLTAPAATPADGKDGNENQFRDVTKMKLPAAVEHPDTARLNWLDDHINYATDDEDRQGLLCDIDGSLRGSQNLRWAIDAARSAEGEERGE